MKDISKTSKSTNKENGRLHIVFSDFNGNNNTELKDIFNNEDTDLIYIGKDSKNFSKLKHKDITDGKVFSKTEWIARKNKSDVLFSLNEEGTGVGVMVKYKRRYKFLDHNQVAAIFTKYYLSKLKKEGSLKSEEFISISTLTSSLIERIASKHNVGSVVQLSDEATEKFSLIKFNQDGTFFIGNSESGILKVIESLFMMITFFKENSINAYDYLSDIYDEYGVHRTTKFKVKLDSKQANKIYKMVGNAKEISGHKVDRKSAHQSEEYINKVYLEDKSWIAISKNSGSGVEVWLEKIGNKGQELLELVSFEKEVGAYIEQNTEVFDDKHFSWKTVFKYTLFISIIVGIMYFVFTVVYSTSTTKGTSVPIFSVAQSVINGVNRWIWLSYWGWWLFLKLLGGWAKKRMFDRLVVKVRIRDIVVSQMMGGIIGFVTPFAVGGDAIGYWYLRRKGVEKAPLIATLSASTIWGEAKFALETIFLVAVGWKLYKDIFDTGDIQAHAALIWFFVGLGWSYFGASMLMILTISRRFQEFIVRNSIRLMEWFPLIHVYDPSGKAAATQYQFFLIRTGMKKLFNKWYFVVEQLIYDMIPLLLSPYALILAYGGGFISPLAPSGQYWSYIVAGDIVGTANSMSLTPGGSGTSEWLNVVVKNHIYSGGSLSHLYSATTIASGIDFADKLLYTWPDLLISTLMIFTGILTVRRKPLRFLKGKGKAIFITTEALLIAIGIVLLTFLI